MLDEYWINVGLMLDNWCGKASFDVKKDMCKKSEKPVFNTRVCRSDGWCVKQSAEQTGEEEEEGNKSRFGTEEEPERRRRKVANTRRNESAWSERSPQSKKSSVACPAALCNEVSFIRALSSKL